MDHAFMRGIRHVDEQPLESFPLANNTALVPAFKFRDRLSPRSNA